MSRLLYRLLPALLLLVLPLLKGQAQPTPSATRVDPGQQADLALIKTQLTEKEFQDYQNWVALGVGGLPHTLEGYRTLQQLNKKLRNPVDLSQLTAKMGKTGDVTTLHNLPKRSGSRPSIAPFAIPHRQTNQHNSIAIRQRQQALFKQVVEQNQSLVHFQKSYFEMHHEAVFLNDSTKGNQTVLPTTHGEIGHLHPSDGSMHFSLSFSDTKEVVEKGWGELHGLAGQVYKLNHTLPATYLMIYSPRTEQELTVVKQILQAAIRYTSLQTPALPAAK